MKVYIGEKVDLTETISLLYVKQLSASTHVINVCMASSCGCSLEACSSEQTELYDGYKREWVLRVGEYILVLTDIQSLTDYKGKYLIFKYYIESL